MGSDLRKCLKYQHKLPELAANQKVSKRICFQIDATVEVESAQVMELRSKWIKLGISYGI